MYAVSFMTFMIQESKALWESRVNTEKSLVMCLGEVRIKNVHHLKAFWSRECLRPNYIRNTHFFFLYS